MPTVATSSNPLVRFASSIHTLALEAQTYRGTRRRTCIDAIITQCEFILDFATFAKRLRVAMAHRNLRTSATAKEIGTDQSHIRWIEAGHPPRAHHYDRIAAWIVKQEESYHA